MAFSVNEFKRNGLTLGGARPSLFEVRIGNVAGVTIPANHRFLIKAAQIPAASVDSVDVGYFGRKIKVAGDRTFNDWTVTVMNDESFDLRKAFESWSNQLNQYEGNIQVPGTSIGDGIYKCDLFVDQFSKSGTQLASYRFVGAFPTSVDAIALNWDTTNQIEEFDVTFAYDYWIPLNSATTGVVGVGTQTPINSGSVTGEQNV